MTDSQLVFDEERAAAMLAVYRTPAMVARRREATDALGLRPGEHLLDGGRGPGCSSPTPHRASLRTDGSSGSTSVPT